MNKTLELSLFPFFSGISRDRLAEIEAFSIVQNYEKGAAVFESNEPARNLYGLIQGDVDLSILFKEEIITKDIKHEEYISTNVENLEKPIIIEKVKNHDIFGWSALVEPERMTARQTPEQRTGLKRRIGWDRRYKQIHLIKGADRRLA